jgi:hypothetical protein
MPAGAGGRVGAGAPATPLGAAIGMFGAGAPAGPAFGGGLVGAIAPAAPSRPLRPANPAAETPAIPDGAPDPASVRTDGLSLLELLLVSGEQAATCSARALTTDVTSASVRGAVNVLMTAQPSHARRAQAQQTRTKLFAREYRRDTLGTSLRAAAVSGARSRNRVTDFGRGQCAGCRDCRVRAFRL